MEWCSASFDPRFRPWYSTAVSVDEGDRATSQATYLHGHFRPVTNLRVDENGVRRDGSVTPVQVSGPKDVVILIDVSGSIRRGRSRHSAMQFAYPALILHVNKNGVRLDASTALG